MLKLSFKIFFVLFSLLTIMFASVNVAYAGGACSNSEELKHPGAGASNIDSHGVVPQTIMNNIKAVNKAVDAKVSRFLALGQAVMCAATDFLSHEWSLAVITIHFPNVTLLLSGLVMWIVGIILVFIIGYYLCDLSFKLGFAVMIMPIAIALWPFQATSKYLGKTISLMFNCAGIFIFLCLGVTLALSLFDAAVSVHVVGADVNSKDAMETMFGYFKEAERDTPAAKIIEQAFNLFSFNFLLILFAGLYGFRLIGSCVNKYTKKFFPDDTGLGNMNPMHKGLTQATSFVAEKAKKAGDLAKNVAKTQLGRGAAKLGGKVSGAIGKMGAALSKKTGGKLGKGLQAIGNIGQKMAANHEAKYQNQGVQGSLKDGNWQPNGGDGSQGGSQGGGAQEGKSQGSGEQSGGASQSGGSSQGKGGE